MNEKELLQYNIDQFKKNKEKIDDIVKQLNKVNNKYLEAESIYQGISASGSVKPIPVLTHWALEYSHELGSMLTMLREQTAHVNPLIADLLHLSAMLGFAPPVQLKVAPLFSVWVNNTLMPALDNVEGDNISLH